MFNISVELMDHRSEWTGSLLEMSAKVKHISFHVEFVIN